MERLKRGLLVAIAVLTIGGTLAVARPVLTSAAAAADSAIAMPNPLWTWAGFVQPLEQQISRAAQSLIRTGHWTFRVLLGLFWDVVDCWEGWLKGALFSLGVAILAALADKGLISVWRAQGLGTMVQDSALMLYVYARLLFSDGVSLGPKLLFLGAFIYGVVQRDFIPDTSLVPGRVEDVVFIVIATRGFIYACPEAVLNEYASRAVSFRRRSASFQHPR